MEASKSHLVKLRKSLKLFSSNIEKMASVQETLDTTLGSAAENVIKTVKGRVADWNCVLTEN